MLASLVVDTFHQLTEMKVIRNNRDVLNDRHGTSMQRTTLSDVTQTWYNAKNQVVRRHTNMKQRKEPGCQTSHKHDTTQRTRLSDVTQTWYNEKNHVVRRHTNMKQRKEPGCQMSHKHDTTQRTRLSDVTQTWYNGCNNWPYLYRQTQKTNAFCNKHPPRWNRRHFPNQTDGAPIRCTDT